jgi:hypothetical protein
MADTTYLSFMAALQGLTVTGVTKKAHEPPRQVSTADLPLQFVRLPTGVEEARTRDHPGGWLTITCELVVLLEPVMQSLPAVNFALTLTMLDNISAALRGTQVGASLNRWTIRGDYITVGDTPFWGIVAAVSNRKL